MLEAPRLVEGMLVYGEDGVLGQAIMLREGWAYVTFLPGYSWWVNRDKLTVGEKTI